VTTDERQPACVGIDATNIPLASVSRRLRYTHCMHGVGTSQFFSTVFSEDDKPQCAPLRSLVRRANMHEWTLLFTGLSATSARHTRLCAANGNFICSRALHVPRWTPYVYVFARHVTAIQADEPPESLRWIGLGPHTYIDTCRAIARIAFNNRHVNRRIADLKPHKPLSATKVPDISYSIKCLLFDCEMCSLIS
jgi:hypothetical protein